MVNNNLMTQALALAVQYYEANGYSVDSRAILKRIKDWYNHSDIADAEVLAAAAIESEYECGADYDTILEWKEFYFPTTPVEYRGYVSTEEIKDYVYECTECF
jgi:hypothetical protein